MTVPAAEVSTDLPNYTVVDAPYVDRKGRLVSETLVKVDGWWFVAGDETHWCTTDEELFAHYPDAKIVARPVPPPTSLPQTRRPPKTPQR